MLKFASAWEFAGNEDVDRAEAGVRRETISFQTNESIRLFAQNVQANIAASNNKDKQKDKEKNHKRSKQQRNYLAFYK